MRVQRTARASFAAQRLDSLSQLHFPSAFILRHVPSGWARTPNTARTHTNVSVAGDGLSKRR